MCIYMYVQYSIWFLHAKSNGMRHKYVYSTVFCSFHLILFQMHFFQHRVHLYSFSSLSGMYSCVMCVIVQTDPFL